MMREMEEDEEEEEVSLSHFIHEHPLTLIENDKANQCYGCGAFFMGEAAYGCKKCGDEKFLHQDCGEMSREIRHPLHPQHTMVQEKGSGSKSCAVCEVKIWRNNIGYFCTSSGCEFQLHMKCTPATPAVGVEKVGDEPTCMKHPSHPQHQLLLLRKRHTFKCDACGIMETGRSYGCLPCQYWIHERCAALPTTSDYPHHHHHPLSLAFGFPPRYSKFTHICDVCRKHLLLNHWMYHCEICRYIVHIKCAIKPPPLPIALNGNADDAQGAIQFPSSHFHEEVIKPFVIRERGEMGMPRDDQTHMFSTHLHPLSLVSLSISEVKDDEDDDDDLDSCGQNSELICDACTTPISSSSPSSSSSSSLDYNKYYMSCGECKYFLHVACFHLPPRISSHPLHKADHTLILEACPKLQIVWMKCSICGLPMNGVIYSCTECSFKVDIKCASLPNTIKHESHPQHRLHSKVWAEEEYIKDVKQGFCSGCHSRINWGILYECGSCDDFTICQYCVKLPAVNKHECDRHPVPLRYDAYLNHPDDFYCDACEREMNPKDWMYHCRCCDTSFHPECFPATSGEFRNIKFGDQYNVPHGLHPHPLTFQLLATKLRCDVCRLRAYGEADVDQRGFHCSSCNFFMCYSRCGRWRLHAISAIDG